MKDDKIKVVIADDHDLIRQGLKRIIEFQEDLSIVGEAKNGEEVLNILKLKDPDVVVLDFNMPFLNGIEVLKKVKERGDHVKAIMLTIENERKTIYEAINVGLEGYVLKDSAGTEIVDAIRTVYNGEKYIDKSLVSVLFSDIKSKEKKEPSILDSLSKREVEVLIKLSKGLSNKEIGEELFLSEKTVKNYATNIFRKLNVDDRVGATIIALKHNINDYYSSKFE